MFHLAIGPVLENTLNSSITPGNLKKAYNFLHCNFRQCNLHSQTETAVADAISDASFSFKGVVSN